jgi:hypothetical protein
MTIGLAELQGVTERSDQVRFPVYVAITDDKDMRLLYTSTSLFTNIPSGSTTNTPLLDPASSYSPSAVTMLSRLETRP